MAVSRFRYDFADIMGTVGNGFLLFPWNGYCNQVCQGRQPAQADTFGIYFDGKSSPCRSGQGDKLLTGFMTLGCWKAILITKTLSYSSTH